jgi:hypothetical protein
MEESMFFSSHRARWLIRKSRFFAAAVPDDMPILHFNRAAARVAAPRRYRTPFFNINTHRNAPSVGPEEAAMLAFGMPAAWVCTCTNFAKWTRFSRCFLLPNREFQA